MSHKRRRHMIKIPLGDFPAHNAFSIPEHKQHYQAGNSHNPERVIKVDPEREAGLYCVSYSDPDSCGYNHVFRDQTKEQAENLVLVYLGRCICAVENPQFDQWINQASRNCWVVSAARTRCRIEYELPNAGITGAYRKCAQLGQYYYIAEY